MADEILVHEDCSYNLSRLFCTLNVESMHKWRGKQRIDETASDQTTGWRRMKNCLLRNITAWVIVEKQS